MIIESLTGSPSKKAFSALLLGIIGYLIYMKNKKSSTDNIKPKERLSKKLVIYVLFRKEEKAALMLFSLRELNSW
jgi:hypothetical protein